MIELLAGTALHRRLAESGDLFTSAAWIDLVADAYGFEFGAACDGDSGAVLPFAVLDDLGGRRLVSLPFSDYVTFSGSARRLFELAEAALASRAAFAMSIRLAGPAPERSRDGWRVAAAAVFHRLAPRDEETLWAGLSPSFRNQLRQAERCGVTVRSDRSLAAIDRFYELHAALRNRKFAALPQPRRFFRLLHDRFIANGKGFVLEAFHADALVAACIALRHRSTLYYKFSASAPPAAALRANNLLLWELARCAAADGLVLDLGRSGSGPTYAGLRHFKEGLGATAYPIAIIERRPPEPDAPDARRAEEFAALVRRVAGLAATAGLDADGNDAVAELLYRYFA